MATDIKPADANKDGKVTPKERRTYRQNKAKAAEAEKAGVPKDRNDKQDRINASVMEQRFGFAKDIVWSNRELRVLWQKAIKEQWTDAMFQSQLRGTNWYQNNAEFARKAWAAEKTGGADWSADLQEADAVIEARATALGANLTPEMRQSLARRYIFEGWNQQGREGFLDDALAESIGTGDNGFMFGESGNLQERLMETARRNGLQYSNSYFESAARSVATGLTTDEDWLRDMRAQAASMWTPWSDKIMSGVDAYDLASGYISMMAQTMEIDPESISLNDPRLMKAIMHVDDKGNTSPIGLYDFQMMLREDPAWMQTKQATDSVSSIGMDVLRMFGFQG